MKPSAVGFHFPFPAQHHFLERDLDLVGCQSHTCVVRVFLFGRRLARRKSLPSIKSEVGEMQARDQTLPRRWRVGISAPHVAGFVETDDSPFDCMPQIANVVVVEHVEDMIECLLPRLLGHAPPAQKLLRRSRTEHAKVQHVETGFGVPTRPRVVEEVVQMLGERILHRQVYVLRHGVAEESDVDALGEALRGDAPACAGAKPVVAQAVANAGVGIGSTGVEPV